MCRAAPSSSPTRSPKATAARSRCGRPWRPGFLGKISARGGSAGGNGGTVEVSSTGQLGYSGYSDLTAAHGSSARCCSTRRNIIIEAAATDGTIVFSLGGGDVFANINFGASTNPTVGAGGTLSISPVDLAKGLNGANVTLQASNDITFVNSLSQPANNGNGNLTLQAGRSIKMGVAGSVLIELHGSLTATANIPVTPASSPRIVRRAPAASSCSPAR